MELGRKDTCVPSQPAAPGGRFGNTCNGPLCNWKHYPHLRHDVEILLSNPVCEAANPCPSVRREPSNDPEVDKRHPAVLQNQQITRMNVLHMLFVAYVSCCYRRGPRVMPVRSDFPGIKAVLVVQPVHSIMLWNGKFLS